KARHPGAVDDFGGACPNPEWTSTESVDLVVGGPANAVDAARARDGRPLKRAIVAETAVHRIGRPRRRRVVDAEELIARFVECFNSISAVADSDGSPRGRRSLHNLLPRRLPRVVGEPVVCEKPVPVDREYVEPSAGPAPDTGAAGESDAAKRAPHVPASNDR